MNGKSSRWISRNIGTLLLAFALAVIVWVSAVTSADPNQEMAFSVPIEIIGLPAQFELINIPYEGRLIDPAEEQKKAEQAKAEAAKEKKEQQQEPAAVAQPQQPQTPAPAAQP